MFTKEMQKALEDDGEKLRQMTGEDHGPFVICCSCGTTPCIILKPPLCAECKEVLGGLP